MYTYSPTLLRVLEAGRPTNDKHAERSALVSNCLSPGKGTQDLCEVFDPRTTTGKYKMTLKPLWCQKEDKMKAVERPQEPT